MFSFRKKVWVKIHEPKQTTDLANLDPSPNPQWSDSRSVISDSTSCRMQARFYSHHKGSKWQLINKKRGC